MMSLLFPENKIRLQANAAKKKKVKTEQKLVKASTPSILPSVIYDIKYIRVRSIY